MLHRYLARSNIRNEHRYEEWTDPPGSAFLVIGKLCVVRDHATDTGPVHTSQPIRIKIFHRQPGVFDCLVGRHDCVLRERVHALRGLPIQEIHRLEPFQLAGEMRSKQ